MTKIIIEDNIDKTKKIYEEVYTFNIDGLYDLLCCDKISDDISGFLKKKKKKQISEDRITLEINDYLSEILLSIKYKVIDELEDNKIEVI